MILNSPYITGSLTVTGNATIQGALIVTGSLSGTASLALNSDLLQGTGSTGFTTTASFNAVSSSQQQISASLLTLTASYTALSSSYIALSGSYNTFSGSASTRVTQIENTYATTGSNSFRADQSITGSLVVSSTITAQTLVVQTVTSSIVYSSGSNLFGNSLSNTQTFTGSVNITGSLALAGNITSNGTAVMLGTGTTNYLPKFTAASTIGNSLVYDNGTSVVIGTATPATNYILTLRTQLADYTKVLDWGTAAGGSWGNMTINTSAPYQTILNSGAWQFNISGTQKMLLDTSGNLGLGVTPSAWYSGASVLQVVGSALEGRTTVTQLWCNGYVDTGATGNFFINTGFASKYTQSSGQHQWFTSTTSGSANAAITFTQAMTLDASGNLGIGLTTPSSKLHIQDSTATTTTINSIAIYGATKQFLFGFISDGTNITNCRIRSGGSIPLSLGTTSSNDALWINNNGNIGIGTNNPGRTLEVSKTAGVDFGLTSVTSGTAEAIFKGYASGTNIDATTSRGTALSLINLDTTNGNANAIVFHNSNQLATSYIVGVNVNHTSRTGDLIFGTSNAAAPTERLRIASTGAATFSSSVKATQFQLSAASGQYYYFDNASGNNFLGLTATNTLGLYVGGNLSLSVASTGAATFSSSNSGNSVSTGNITLLSTATAINDRLTINFAQTGIVSRARAGIGSVAEESSGYAASLAFYTRTAIDGSALATTDERMRITSGGNVYIGATTGAYPASGYMLGVKAPSGTQTYISITAPADTLDSQGLVIGVDTNAASFYMRDAKYMNFHTTNTERMRITSGGNVLIGTTTDDTVNKLQVTGDIKVSAKLKVGSSQISTNTVTSAITTAKTIYSRVGNGKSEFVFVMGDVDGTAYFADIVSFASGASVVVISSTTTYGSPSARTYSVSGNNLQLSMASGTAETQVFPISGS